MKKENLKRLFAYILWSGMPEELTEQTLSLVFRHLHEKELLEELLEKLKKKIGADNVSFIRQVQGQVVHS